MGSRLPFRVRGTHSVLQRRVPSLSVCHSLWPASKSLCLTKLPSLPVPGLWLDVFQKIKALGYSGVSFYVDWALVEGKQGDFSAEGVFSFEPFFEAASEAGIYLLAVRKKIPVVFKNTS